MNKTNILTGIIGIFAGFFIGFTLANNLNRSALQTTAAAPPISAAAASNSELPANHPQLNPGQPLPEVAAALKTADTQPQDFNAQMSAGDLYYKIEKFDDAAKYYERAARLRPDSVPAMVKTGNANFDGNHYETAEKWYTAALAKNPDDADVRTDLGLTFYLRTPPDLDRAVKEYKTALDKNPNHELALQNLIVALNDKGDTQSSKEATIRLAKLNPNNPLITGQPLQKK
jgi:tetratricopeptide (TPR) repeat protein